MQGRPYGGRERAGTARGERHRATPGADFIPASVSVHGRRAGRRPGRRPPTPARTRRRSDVLRFVTVTSSSSSEIVPCVAVPWYAPVIVCSWRPPLAGSRPSRTRRHPPGRTCRTPPLRLPVPAAREVDRARRTRLHPTVDVVDRRRADRALVDRHRRRAHVTRRLRVARGDRQPVGRPSRDWWRAVPPYAPLIVWVSSVSLGRSRPGSWWIAIGCRDVDDAGGRSRRSVAAEATVPAGSSFSPPSACPRWPRAECPRRSRPTTASRSRRRLRVARTSPSGAISSALAASDRCPRTRR